MKFAFRGYGNHSKKIESILRSIYSDLEIYSISREFLVEDIKPDTKAIFICSPNNTHLKYIKRSQIINNKIPIYCEKPIINSHLDCKEGLNFLKNYKIFPGFNLRRSQIPNIIFDNQKKYNLGNIKSFHVNQSYPFGLRDSFSNSWKSNTYNCPLGVLENLSIHFIDLAFYLFGVAMKKELLLSDFINNYSRTCDCMLEHNNGVISYIHNSYSEKVTSNLKINFEKGQIEIDENGLKVFYPILNIDKKTNLCIEPELVEKSDKKLNEFIKESLSLSINQFLLRLKNNEHCNFDDSIITTAETFDFINKASKYLILKT